MPQKRNPVSIEYSRSIASSAVAKGMAVNQTIHNTTYGDINDTEDDLQPHLYTGFKKANRVLKLMCAVILTMDFDKERAYQQARENMITITELLMCIPFSVRNLTAKRSCGLDSSSCGSTSNPAFKTRKKKHEAVFLRVLII